MTQARISLCILLAATILSFTACGGGHSGETYVLVTTNVNVPYWQTAAAGFSQSANQLKVAYEFVGSETYDPAAERDALQRVIQKKPAGILISVADANLMKEGINQAIDAGIPIP